VSPQTYTRRELIHGRALFGLARQAVAAAQEAVARRIAPAVGAAPAAATVAGPPVVRQQTPSTPEAAARRRSMPLLRPPGAVDEPSFLRDCTGCMDCAAVCPAGAIVEAPIRLREAAGTPIIVPEAAACRMCHDMPCIAACDTGALSAAVPIKLGTARVLPHACMGTKGLGCSACVEHCPVDGAIDLERGTPVVDADTCTGCGVCAEICPAPERAIMILPQARRPEAP